MQLKKLIIVPINVFAYIWITYPLILFLILYSMHSKVQQFYGTKCQKNFIVDIDEWLFGRNIYNYIEHMQNWFFDFLSALSYLLHYSLPFIYSIYLFLSHRGHCKFFQFLFSFGIVSVISVLLQYIIPTAPPWMLAKKPPEGNFERVDAVMELEFFKSIYSMSTCVCGAFPSLHTAWPTVILFTKPWIGKWFAWLHVCLIAFAAVYSMHHYIIDVVCGFALAWCSCKLGNYILKIVPLENLNYFHANKSFKNGLNGYDDLTNTV